MKKVPLNNTIFTIGHSTRTLEEFIEVLHSFKIEMLVDVRRYPGSRRYPYFNKEALEISLPQYNIRYQHLIELGGRRKVTVDSKNTVWRHAAFRGYADYMETAPFKEGISVLEEIALQQPTVIMCSEAVWWRCHRSMISDYLKANGWKVMHIMGIAKAEEHPYTAPAKIEHGQLTYREDNNK